MGEQFYLVEPEEGRHSAVSLPGRLSHYPAGLRGRAKAVSLLELLIHFNGKFILIFLFVTLFL